MMLGPLETLVVIFLMLVGLGLVGGAVMWLRSRGRRG